MKDNICDPCGLAIAYERDMIVRQLRDWADEWTVTPCADTHKAYGEGLAIRYMADRLEDD